MYLTGKRTRPLRNVLMSLNTASHMTKGGLAFDLTERAFLLVLSSSAILRLAPSVALEPQILMLLLSEVLAVAFILLRRPALTINISPYAAGVAFLGTAAPLLVIATPGAG